jgi:hypothetical protein
MTTIEILGWKDNFAGFTAWDEHAKSELRKRLRRGLNATPAEVRRLLHQIRQRQPVSLQHVRDEAVYGLTQILQTSGAEVRVSVADSSVTRLFRRIPKR